MCLIIINKLTNNNIIMNDSVSIFLATTILALGGLGLYMFKSSDDKQSGGGDEEYNEDSLFGSGSFFSLGAKEETEDHDKFDEMDEDDYKPHKKKPKTQKNRKSSNNSKRRY
jgi:hypothetical protein